MTGIPLARQALYASSGDRAAEVFVRPRAEMSLVEIYILRWRDVDEAQVREALTRDRGWAQVAAGAEAPIYDSIVAGRAGVTVDIDLLAGVLERARSLIDSLAAAPDAFTVARTVRRAAELDGRIVDGEVVVGPEAGIVHYHPSGDEPAGVVRPVGLVWSGIRVDELERIGYEVLGPVESCPVRLEDGEIFGVPEQGVIYVWSRTDFDRLVDLSRRLHDARRSGGPGILEEEGRAVMLAGAGADSLDVVKALPSAD